MPKTAPGPYLSVVDFETLQHYKNRNPIWIKLYSNLWDNHRFESLADDAKAHFIGLCVLASKHDNHIPYEPEWIARKLGANKTIDFKSLFASGLLAHSGGKRYQVAIPEKEKEESRDESREERDATKPTASRRDDEYEEFVGVFELRSKPTKYDRTRTQDFVQLAKLRKVQGTPVPNWTAVIANYFESDIATHTVAHLCSIYEPLTKGPIDRYGKHRGNGNGIPANETASERRNRENRAVVGGLHRRLNGADGSGPTSDGDEGIYSLIRARLDGLDGD